MSNTAYSSMFTIGTTYRAVPCNYGQDTEPSKTSHNDKLKLVLYDLHHTLIECNENKVTLRMAGVAFKQIIFETSPDSWSISVSVFK